MIPPCEIMTQEFFPAVRSIIAKELTSTLGYSQKEAAEAMGITQPAVSQYLKSIRGNKKVMELSRNVKVMLVIKEVAKELYKLPKKEKIKKMCEICKAIRESGILEKYGYNTKDWPCG